MMGITAAKNDLERRGSFVLFISSSRVPSSTISIRPTVPNRGKSEFRLGILILKSKVSSLVPHPSASSKRTDGIFVREEVISKTYDKRIKMLKAISIDAVKIRKFIFSI
jgi:hypothetical protein